MLSGAKIYQEINSKLVSVANKTKAKELSMSENIIELKEVVRIPLPRNISKSTCT